ncbi:hypothetical protein C8R43DRAFT_503743 [Mycena crocata]|nr:hypothetical protein C8R43DRAFT_503743 [Mycena crocata]
MASPPTGYIWGIPGPREVARKGLPLSPLAQIPADGPLQEASGSSSGFHGSPRHRVCSKLAATNSPEEHYGFRTMEPQAKTQWPSSHSRLSIRHQSALYSSDDIKPARYPPSMPPFVLDTPRPPITIARYHQNSLWGALVRPWLDLIPSSFTIPAHEHNLFLGQHSTRDHFWERVRDINLQLPRNASSNYVQSTPRLRRVVGTRTSRVHIKRTPVHKFRSPFVQTFGDHPTPSLGTADFASPLMGRVEASKGSVEPSSSCISDVDSPSANFGKLPTTGLKRNRESTDEDLDEQIPKKKGRIDRDPPEHTLDRAHTDPWQEAWASIETDFGEVPGFQEAMRRTSSDATFAILASGEVNSDSLLRQEMGINYEEGNEDVESQQMRAIDRVNVQIAALGSHRSPPPAHEEAQGIKSINNGLPAPKMMRIV